MELSDLKRRKNNLKLTVGQLALLANLPVGTVSKIMTGETQNPSYLTVDILDKTLAKKEMEARINAYRNAMTKYIKEHPDEVFIYEEFEKKYREEHKLNRKAIPYATPDNDPYWISGNLALEAPKAETKEEGYITYDEFRTMDKRAEGVHYELLDGQLITNEAASPIHQKLAHKLGFVIESYITTNNGPCELYPETGVHFPEDEDTYLIPDISVVCDPDNVTDEYIIAPDWIIEVTSPSTHKLDYRDKMIKYQENGVREYWIVDLKKKATIVYINENEGDISIYGFEDDIPVYIYDGKLKINISDHLALNS